MKKYILGTKQIMTQLFTDEGVCVPVTIVAAAPCVVTQVKTLKTDGYNAVQIGYGKRKISRLTKAEIGQRKKLGDFSKLKEFRVTDVANYKIGDQLTVKQFTAGDKVKISGISKGKGFQGV
ncbi:MAG: 50S ribosomal protein L3, partial [Patescibacteria group bacterium]